MFRKLFLVIFVIAILLSVGCQSNEPPNLGGFLNDGSQYLDLKQVNAVFGQPDKEDLVNILIAPNTKPTITLWYPNVVVENLRLMSRAGSGHEIPIKITPQGDEGILEIEPSESLSDDIYCLVQGDPLGVELATWCFQVGGDEDSTSSTEKQSELTESEITNAENEVVNAENAATRAVAEEVLADATRAAVESNQASLEDIDARRDAGEACTDRIRPMIQSGDYSAIIPGANLAGCDLSNLDLFGMNLSGANLSWVNFSGANLEGVDFTGANVKFAFFTPPLPDNIDSSQIFAVFAGSDKSTGFIWGESSNAISVVFMQGEIHTYDLLTGEIVDMVSLDGRNHSIGGVTQSPDGSMFAVPGGIFDTNIYDTNSGTEIIPENDKLELLSYEWNINGEFFAGITSGERATTVFNLHTKEIFSLPGRLAGWGQTNPNLMATVTDSNVFLYDVQSQTELSTIEYLSSDSQLFPQAAFSPDGTNLLFHPYEGKETLIWDIQNEQEIAVLTFSTERFKNFWTPDGAGVIEFSMDEIDGDNVTVLKIWDIASSSYILESILGEQLGIPEYILEIPKTDLFIDNNLNVLDIYNGKIEARFGRRMPRSPGQVTISPDGNYVAFQMFNKVLSIPISTLLPQ